MNYQSFKIVKLSVCDCIFGVPVAWKHPTVVALVMSVCVSVHVVQ
jgi:hypothetical protein